ncbi:MAG: hypothetical protein ACR2O6_10540, partial [Ilumatobacteraceae bacterium]
MSRATPVARLLVDVRPLDHPASRERGIGRYTLGLLRGLAGIGAPVTALASSDVEADLVRTALPEVDVRPWGPAAIRAAVDADADRRDGARAWYLATQLMLSPVDLDPIPSIITNSGLPVAAIMYDVIPYRHRERYEGIAGETSRAALRVPLARTVDVMLPISAFSAETASEVLGFPRERMRVIGAGVDDRFVPVGVRRVPRPG